MKKRILSLLLALVMLLGMLPTVALAAEDETTSGECGDNAAWSYDADTKTLTIIGTGAMDDFEDEDSMPWAGKSYTESITNIVVNEGVTSIGDYAFAYLPVETVTLADSVQKIGEDAFALTNITNTDFLPANVSISDSAFEQCEKLTSVTIPAGVEVLPRGAFAYCDAVESITLPAGLKTIGQLAFCHSTKVSTIQIPSSVTSIAVSAFGNWTSAQKIIFPSNYSQSTIDAFPAGWNGSAQVVVLTVTYSGNCGATGNDENVTWAYYEAAGLLEISGTGAMADYGQNKAPWHKQSWTNDIKSIVVNDRVTSIGNNAFMKLTGVTADKIRIADTVETIGTGAFANNNITNIDFLPDGLKVVSKQSFYGCKSLTTIVLPSKCVEVGNSAFFGCSNVTQITLPNGLTTLQSGAFSGVTKVAVIKIPASLTTVVGTPFTKWTSQQQIVFPEDYSRETVASFPTGWNGSAEIVYGEPKETEKILEGSCGESAKFSYDTETKTMTISGTGAVTVPTDGTDKSNWTAAQAGTTKLVIGSGITELGANAFSSWTSVTEVSLPDTLTKIGDSALQNMTALKELTLPVSVTAVGARAIEGGPKTIRMASEQADAEQRLRWFGQNWCGKATVVCGEATLEVPETADANDAGTVRAAYYPSSKTLYVFGTGVYEKQLTTWQYKAEKIVVEEGVTELKGPFTAYKYVTEVVLPESCTKLNTRFDCQNLTTINIPSKLENIGLMCFEGLKKLPALHIPATITEIGVQAFSACSYTQELYIDLTWEQAEQQITYGRNWFGNAKVYYKNASGEGYELIDPSPYGWLEGVTFQYAENGTPLKSWFSAGTTETSITYGVDKLEPFTLTGMTLTLTKDGQPFTDAAKIDMPDTLHVEEVGTGLWRAQETVTITPREGLRTAKAQTYQIRFLLEEKPYSFEGEGTEANPYKIRSLDELKALEKNVNTLHYTYDGKYFLQTADIDMTGVTDWKPIGYVQNTSAPYPLNATYDGGGHKITNWTVDCQTSGTRYFGLFGRVSVLKNLTLDETCSFKLRSWSATFAYQTDTLENCVSYATVTGQTTSGDNANASLGGLVKTTVEMINCANYGSIDVKGGGYVGGLAVSGYIVVGCRNYGTVSATGTKVGGIVSSLDAYGSTEENPYGILSGSGNQGAVTGGSRVGGLVGESSGIIEDCYNTGTVTATGTTVGGLAGVIDNTSSYTDKLGVFNSYHAGAVAYGDAEGDPQAGHLVGLVQGRGDTAACFGSLYYQAIGVLPAVGTYDAGDAAKAMKLSDMKLGGFVKTLNDYQNISLRGATWSADADGKNSGLPVISATEKLKNYENKILTLTLNGQNAVAGENHTFSCLTLPYGTDLTQVEMVATVSNRATIEPASGSKLDFSNGPVTITVTAENGSVQEYVVTTSAASTASGLLALRLAVNNFGMMEYLYDDYHRGTLLLDLDDFKSEQTSYSFSRYDKAVQDTRLSANKSAYFWAVPADANAVMTAAIKGSRGETSKVIKACTDLMADSNSNMSYWLKAPVKNSLMEYGQNTITLTVTPPESSAAETIVYSFNIEMLPSLKSVTFAEQGLEQDKTFAYDTLNYTLTVPSSVTSLTPTATPSMGDMPAGSVSFEPALVDGKLNLDGFTSFKVLVTGGEGENQRTTTYTYTLFRSRSYTAQLETNAAGAQLRIYDEAGTKLTPENGVYSLVSGKTYTYVVAAKGYKSKTGKITGPSDLTDGKLKLTLEAVAPNTLKQLDALWPSFRGNDENMAITSSKTRITAEKTGLLWSTAAGKGMDTGAVGSPIIVDGYLYAYSGTNILKIDKATGEIVKKGDMVATSDFAIIPPTYAEGMIFVGLSKGRVQAFNAETLESLWVYTDPRGGQSNSPITYSDGCVYTGFWNGESGRTNFVCLTIDDEDPTAKTEAKQALWTHTQPGGFYWAGAYAHGDYVLVGTDDGQSGYTSPTANLLVFDKTSGEVVDSKTGYIGDIRSNVAYDADTDRVYFTSKGGHFYSEQIDWKTGKIKPDASKDINLGGMSTSTPVVYNGRAYVGVSGTAQFTVGTGHHIAVLDLDNWNIAYTANTKGYPQTSGLLTTAYEAETGYVYVYFMDNYTPGALRVIRDKKGQTGLLDGVTEVQVGANGTVTTVENCAPIVFEPKGELAQYCICSPIADENGVIYFKNDTGNMMAVGHVTGFQGWTVTFDANGGTIPTSSQYVTNKLSNKLEKMPTARRDGYTLLGWFTEQDGGERVTLDTVYAKDTTVYAHWEKAADPERKDSVTVYFSISNDGEYLKSDVTGKTLAQLPVTLNYFDLKEYDLEDFYRTGADGKAIVHPTLLHLFIRMLEEQYLGLGNKLVPGVSVGPKQYGNNESEEPYKALKITGAATSMYMTNFWGHDENLLYYVNHQYPLMYEGWGSTADWILLEDGDAIEVAMFTDWDFIHNEEAGFPYFRQGNAILDDLTLAAGEQQTLTVARATADASGERGEKLNPNTKIYYTTNLNRVSGDVTTWTALGTTDASGNITVSFDAPGTYYIAVPGSSVRAPGICKVTIVADAAVAAAASKINAIGPVDETSGDKIKAAREAFDALTSEQQAQIPEATRNKLIEAEKAYQAILNQKATNEAIQKINAIGEVTKDSGAAIKSARDAYNELTDAQKKLVTNYDKLTAAEARWSELNPIPAGTPAQLPQNPNAGETLPFTDVNANSWYYFGVKFAYEKGLMNGTGNGTFSPNADTTRGMIVTMLARLEGQNTSGTPWYAAGQKWAMDAGISDGTNMTGAITREQLAAILFRYAKQKGYDVGKSVELNGFEDANTVSTYATDAMRWAVANGLIQGSNSKLNPKGTATRAQVATILMRFMELYAK